MKISNIQTLKSRKSTHPRSLPYIPDEQDTKPHPIEGEKIGEEESVAEHSSPQHMVCGAEVLADVQGHDEEALGEMGGQKVGEEHCARFVDVVVVADEADR